MNDNYELYHHGVKGMKWGVRKKREDYSKRYIRGHAGPANPGMLTRKRQLARDKRDLEELNQGKHLSIGLTKKRQAAYDARDKAILEKRIAKNEAASEQKVTRAEKGKKAVKVGSSVCVGIVAGSLGAKAVYTLTGSSLASSAAAGYLGGLAGLKYYDLVSNKK